MKHPSKRVGLAVFGVAACAVTASSAHAFNTTYQEIAAPLQDVPAIDDAMTTGNEMAGMTVTAFFTGNTASETVVWQDAGGTSGQAVGTAGQGWSLAQAGDTFLNEWTLIYNGGNGLLTGLSIDGFGDEEVLGTVFDRTFGFEFGTDNSFLGRDFDLTGEEPFDILVTYSGAVGVAGDAPVGDVFRNLELKFVIGPQSDTGSVQDAGLDGDTIRTISYLQDTDEVIIPEPASLALIGLGALAVLKPRRR